MRPSLIVVMLLVGLGGNWARAAEDAVLTLSNNPFSRPDILKPKPRPAPDARVVLPPDEVELALTATMVSENAPMVIVNGELIGIGDRIEGLKLIAVMEGRAVFTRGGRKFSFEIETKEPQSRGFR